MRGTVQYWAIRREVELLSGLGAEVVERFRAALREGRDAEAADLVRPLVRVASRLSYLLWPAGGWATDPGSASAAETLRRELEIRDDTPISPGSLVAYTAVAPMSASELRRAADCRSGVLRLGQHEYLIEPVIAALLEIHGRTARAADAA